MSQPLFVELYASSRTGLRAQTLAAVSQALRQGTMILMLGLDSLPTLDDAVIAATIVALRRIRERGGTVRLVTRSVEHRTRLALAGLDRVFDIFSSAEDADGQRARRHRSFQPRQFAASVARRLASLRTFLSRTGESPW